MYNEKVYSGNISATYNYKITKRFFLIMAYVLFFMMLFVPTTYQPVKAVLLFMVLSGITLSTIARGRITLHPQILLWTLLMMTVGLSFMFWGFINYAPGALRVGTVHLLWPFVYTMLVAGAVSERVLTGLLKVLVLATIAIGLYGFSFILYAYGWLPEILYIPIDQGQAIGFYQGFVEFNLYSLASLLFLVPFIVGCLLVWSKNDAMPISRLWLWIALFLGLLLVLLSGRRALLLVVAVSPFIALILRSFLPAEIKHKNRKSVLRLILGSGVMLACLGVYL
ncbi:hypothetical protein M1N64_04580 [Peptococcaceae bacterium]|nr:hypothetical protein [Peptococcaceae bacterium]